MCEICRQSPCHVRCPNSSAECKPVEVCDNCKAKIYAGDKYFDEGAVLCEHCVDNMEIGEFISLAEIDFDLSDLFEVLGLRLVTAEEEDW